MSVSSRPAWFLDYPEVGDRRPDDFALIRGLRVPVRLNPDICVSLRAPGLPDYFEIRNRRSDDLAPTRGWRLGNLRCIRGAVGER